MIAYFYGAARARKIKKIAELKPGAWVHVVDPSAKELDRLSKDLDLDRDILTDATDVYEAPRVEESDSSTYVFVRYCRPEDPDIPTEPMLIIYTDKNIVTVMRSNDKILDRMVKGEIDFLTTQKTKTFLHILDQINQSYRAQLNIISKQILTFRGELRKTEARSVDLIKFIELEEDLNEYISALQPQELVLNALQSGRFLKLYESDQDLVEDITLNTRELIGLCKTRLRTVVNIRQAYDILAANNLNKIFKRLTSIAIFISLATLVAGVYGMNITLPLQNNAQSFLIVMGLTAGLVFLVFRYFNRRNWF